MTPPASTGVATDAARTVTGFAVPLTRVRRTCTEEVRAVGDHVRAAELAALVAREHGDGGWLDALLEAV